MNAGRQSMMLRSGAIFLAVVGFSSRLAPLLAPGGRLLRQFPSEDGYLMLTIARNLALGHGMSTAAGTMPTNGVQPLTTFLWAAGFLWSDGQRAQGVAFALIVQLVVAAATALLLHRLGCRVLPQSPTGRASAALAAAAWFAGPTALPHTMNCLESGVYVFTCVLIAERLVVAADGANDALSLPGVLWRGGLLGLSFLVRNDAVFLVLAACIAHLAAGWSRGRAIPRSRIISTLAMGAVSVLVGLPWVLHNLQRFGHAVPISGRAESLHATLGENLLRLPSALAEHALLVLPIPATLQDTPPLVALSALVCLGVLWLQLRLWRGAGAGLRRLMAFVAIFGGCLVLFYGVFFGAGHFMSRYLFPLSPFLALFSVAALVEGLGSRAPGPLRACVVVACALALAANARLFVQGERHVHFQLVEWVEQHVPAGSWVGARQSGAVGFFHDRTINLDGKVNQAAYEARVAGTVPGYVIGLPVEYLVGWHQLTRWAPGGGELREHFELIVDDAPRDLAVFRRRSAAELHGL